MPDDGSPIERALEGTALEGRSVAVVPILDTDEVGYELDFHGLDALTAWRAARPAVVDLGLWPIVCGASGQDVYRREDEDRSQWPRAIVARASGVTWPPPPRDATEDFDRDWVEVIAMCAEETILRVGDAPTEEQLLTVCPDPHYEVLERHLLLWEEARRPTDRQEPLGRFDEPPLQVGTTMILLPDPHPWVVPAYLAYCLVASQGHEALVRAMRDWHDRYGAVPYAATGVTLHLIVEHPLTDVFEALQVATEQMPFCKMDDSLRERARSLFGAAFWELYDRP